MGDFEGHGKSIVSHTCCMYADKAAPGTYLTEDKFEDYTTQGFINGRTGGLQADKGMWRAPEGRTPDIQAVLHTDPYGEYRNTGLDRYMDVSSLHDAMEARKNRVQPKLTREQIEKLKKRKKDIKKKIRLHDEMEEEMRGCY